MAAREMKYSVSTIAISTEATPAQEVSDRHSRAATLSTASAPRKGSIILPVALNSYFNSLPSI